MSGTSGAEAYVRFRQARTCHQSMHVPLSATGDIRDAPGKPGQSIHQDERLRCQKNEDQECP